MTTDQVVLITGATGDFGPHVVRAFMQTGARLAPTGRKLDGVEALVRDLGLGPERALSYAADVTDAHRLAPLIVLRGAFGPERLLEVVSSLLANRAGWPPPNETPIPP